MGDVPQDEGQRVVVDPASVRRGAVGRPVFVLRWLEGELLRMIAVQLENVLDGGILAHRNDR